MQINSFATIRPSDINGNTKALASEGEFKMAARSIISILDVGGTILAIVIILIIGIQYMKGSLEQKAQYKETLIPYTIGCLFLFLGPKIAGIIYRIATQI